MMDQLKASFDPTRDPSSFPFSNWSSFIAVGLLGGLDAARSSPTQLRMLKPLEEEEGSISLWPDMTVLMGKKSPVGDGMYIGR